MRMKVLLWAALLVCLLFPVITQAQSTWSETGQQYDSSFGSTNPFWPPLNNYSTEAYDPLTGQMMYYGRNQASGGQIYSGDLLAYKAGSNAWTQLATAGTYTSTCAGSGPPSSASVPDTSVRPGTGHPTGNQAYDWRHGYFFLWGRVTCGGTEDTAWLFPTSIDSPTAGAHLFSGGSCPLVSCQNAWSLQLGSVGGATTPFGAWEGTMSYDPVDNYIMGFGGLTCVNQTGSCLSINNYIWKYIPATNKLSVLCPSGTATSTCTGQGTYACPGGIGVGCPGGRGGASFIWDWYHNDRFIVFGGYLSYGANDGCDAPSVHPTGSDAMWWWFPKTGTWQMANPTGSGPSRACYAWFQSYDTLRDYVWMFDDNGGLYYYDVKSNSWSLSGIQGGPGPNNNPIDPMPSSIAQMYYDGWTDQIVALTARGAAHQAEHVWTLPLAPSFPPPKIVGNFPTSTTALSLPRPVARPGSLGGTYTDPATGAVVKRMTTATSRGVPGGTMDAASCAYSQTQCWSFDNAYMVLADGRIINTLTQATVCSGVFNSVNNPVWDPTSDRIIGWGDGSTFSRLAYVQLTVPGCVATKLWDFSSTYNTAGCTPGNASEIHNVSWQDTDSTGTYTIGNGCRISDTTYQLFVLNIRTGVKGPDLGALQGGCSTPTGPDYAMVDWQGKYALVAWGPAGASAVGVRYCGMEAFSLSTAANPAGSWNFLGQVTPADDHLDLLVDKQGQEWVVQYSDQNGWDGSGVPRYDVVKCKITGQAWSSANCVALSPTGFGIGGHISCHDYSAADPYCVWSDDLLGSRQDDPWLPFKGEIVQVYPDSTLATPHIKRLVHTYTDIPYVEHLPSLPCGNNASYWTLPKPIIRNDGQQVEFASNFGPTCSSEAYVIQNAIAAVTVGNLPTVSITSPTSGVTVSGTTMISANAAGNGASIAWVEFDLDGNPLGQVATTAPYSFSWNSSTAANGNHTLVGVASDTSGNRATSAPVLVKVSNISTPPSITISSPSNGLVMTKTITVSANASANAGVASVQFRLDGANIGAAIVNAPFQISWDTSTATNGGHTLTAVAVDKLNMIATSTPVGVTVSNSGGSGNPPTVTITSPTSGATVSGTTSISANAAGNGAAIASVVFDMDGSPAGPAVTAAPYSLSWNSGAATNGNHTLVAVASDTSGNRATSAPVVVKVSNINTPSSVTISSPSNGLVVAKTITVSANASASAGVATVQFKLDGITIGAALANPPFQVSWNTATASNGVHGLTAVVTDKSNVSATSNPVVVTVSNSAGTGTGSAGGSGGGATGVGQFTALLPGSSTKAGLDNNTIFQVDAQDLASAVSACTACTFRAVTDLLPGQTTEVQLHTPVSGSTALGANVITLKQGAINGIVVSTGNNEFVIQTTDGSLWPSSILVITSRVTDFMNASGPVQTIQAGQAVAVRGLLFKNGPQGGPTLVARIVSTDPSHTPIRMPNPGGPKKGNMIF